MSEHNKNFYSLEEVERCLESSKEFQDGEEIYYFIGALRYVYDENKRLNNIINELERLLNNQIENYKDSDCEELQAMVQEDRSILFIL